MLALKMEEGHEPRYVSNFWKLKKARKQILPQSFQKQHSSASTLILVQWDLILQTWPPELCDNQLVLFKATKYMVSCYSSNRKITPKWIRKKCLCVHTHTHTHTHHSLFPLASYFLSTCHWLFIVTSIRVSSWPYKQGQGPQLLVESS